MDAPLQIYHSLTQVCNWKCPYCEFPNITSPEHTDIEYFKVILSQIKKITDKYDIEHCVEGGELGLAPVALLDLFFNSELAKSYHVSTNGNFLEKDYHNKYYDKIHSILYHVKPEIIDTTYDFNDYHIYGIRFYYTIVITKENIDLIDSFFSYHPDKLFVPHVLQPRTKNLSLMNIDYYKKIYDIVKDKKNIVSGFIKRYKFIIDNFEKENFMGGRTLICCNDYVKMMIDYTTKTLIRCCISTESDRVELTIPNLKTSLENDKPIFPSWDETCKECIAGFIFKDIYYTDSIEGRHNFLKSIKKMSNYNG